MVPNGDEPLTSSAQYNDAPGNGFCISAAQVGAATPATRYEKHTNCRYGPTTTNQLYNVAPTQHLKLSGVQASADSIDGKLLSNRQKKPRERLTGSVAATVATSAFQMIPFTSGNAQY
jgi:hypothetical protein